VTAPAGEGKKEKLERAQTPSRINIHLREKESSRSSSEVKRGGGGGGKVFCLRGGRGCGFFYQSGRLRARRKGREGSSPRDQERRSGSNVRDSQPRIQNGKEGKKRKEDNAADEQVRRIRRKRPMSDALSEQGGRGGEEGARDLQFHSAGGRNGRKRGKERVELRDAAGQHVSCGTIRRGGGRRFFGRRVGVVETGAFSASTTQSLEGQRREAKEASFVFAAISIVLMPSRGKEGKKDIVAKESPAESATNRWPGDTTRFT